MMHHDKRSYEIAHKACTLSERINFSSTAQMHSPEHVDNILSRWNKAVSPGCHATFIRRLSRDGLTEDHVKKALSKTPDFSKGLPTWMKIFNAVTDQCPGALEDVRQGKWRERILLSGEGLVVFPELWLPFFRHGWKCLSEEAGAAFKLFSKSALNALQRQLFMELSALGELAAYRQFVIFRNARVLTNSHKAEDSYHIYHLFVTMLLGERLFPFFQEYSVLARQLCRLIDTWVKAGSELLMRLDRDRRVIADEFGQCRELGKVEEFTPSLSDRHHGGRRVVGLAFSSGLKLIYKPRNVAQEYAYNQLLSWIRQKGLAETPTSLKVVQFDDYGWIEFVTQSACHSEKEVESYYYKAGILACLIYVMCGNDCHRENLVATRKGPVLVDIESLVQPHLSNKLMDILQNNLDSTEEPEDNSVLSTGLLDFAVRTGMDGRISDGSGLRGIGDFDLYNKKRIWRRPNTDGMTLDYEKTKIEPMQNILIFAGQIQYPEDHADSLIDGFTRAYRFILSHREELLAESGPLSLFIDTPTRIIHRSSNDYAIFLYGLATPKYQKKGLDRSIALEYLAKVLDRAEDNPELWNIFFQERQSIEDLDIPHFASKASLNTLINRFNKLGESDLEFQSGLIRGILNVFNDDCAHVKISSSNPEYLPTKALSNTDLIIQGELIAEQIQTRAIYKEDGTIIWTTPAYELLEQLDGDEISPYLYDGAGGIALFFAALTSITNNEKYEKLVSITCKSLIYSVEKKYQGQNLDSECIGVCNGLGSVIYILVTISRILGNDNYLDLAKRIATLVTQKRIFTDRRLDVEGGSAGCLMALLALYECDNNPIVLEQAMNCAKHLLECSYVQGGERGWKNQEGIMLAGFAHGASGIALALLRLYRITGHRLYSKAAREALKYEQGLFSGKEGNWPVLRKLPNNKIDASFFMTAWCHGASGIGLARIGMLNILDDESIRNEIEYALKATMDYNYNFDPIDYLCCGNLGRIETLLTAGLAMRKSELVQAAREYTYLVFHRAQKEGYFGMRSKTWENRCFQPGFFKGLSGIGYTLLRMAYPDILPSILLFEP